MNPMDILKNLGNFQEKLKESQEKLKDISAIGRSGGDMVTITLRGDMSISELSISPEAVDPEDIQMLRDLIIAAHRDAMVNIREQLTEQMSSLTGGMPIPPEFMG